VKREVSEAQGEAKSFANQHPIIKDLWRKYTKDNVGMLAAFVSWGVLTSIVPILVGLVAISGFVLQAAHVKAEVVSHLADATQGAFTAKDIQSLVNVSTNHAGLLGIIGFVGILWGGSNVGGSISTAFQAIFEVSGRSFIKEKLIDIAMIFVFAVMMVLIILGTSAGTIVTQLFSSFPLPGLATVVGLAISLIAAFLLFATIYLVFPNIEPPFKFSAVWRGAAVAAVLFTILSLVWPLYASHAHFGRYGTLLTPILILTAWIYFFSMILMIGAEVVAVLAIREAQSKGESIGPAPQESVPQHEVLRDRGGAQAAQ
jgi:YihY family inner membrane protein